MRNQKFFRQAFILWLFVVFLTSVNSYAETTANGPVANEHGTNVTGSSGKVQPKSPEVMPHGPAEQVPPLPQVTLSDLIGLVGGFFTYLTIITGAVGIMLGAVPFIIYFVSRSLNLDVEKHRKELEERHSKVEETVQLETTVLRREIQKRLEYYDQELDKALDRQSGRHEERLYHAELVLGQLWSQRDKKIQVASADMMTRTFLEEFPKHLKDNLILRQLLLPDQKAIHEALGTLERYDYLPREIVALVRLLYKQGRLKDAGVLSAARKILERFDERLTEEEGKST